MKNSKVVNVQGSGMFKELYVFEVELDNGDVGKIYRKSNDSKLSNGQDISYTINDKGSIKIVTDYQKNNQSQSSPKQDDVQKLIVKQSSLKAAVDYDNKCTPEDVLKNAQMFYEWVWGLTPTQSKINKVAEKIDSDLPF
jgi:hypothetical protein|tara:strand:+ start:207 stop:623 length:417 start_codon:yes stop_codon:yes gene_type:complete